MGRACNVGPTRQCKSCSSERALRVQRACPPPGASGLGFSSLHAVHGRLAPSAWSITAKQRWSRQCQARPPTDAHGFPDAVAASLHLAGCRFSGRAKAQSGCGAPTWRPRACPPRAVRSVRARFPGPHVAIALASGARHATGTSRGRQSARKVGTRMQGRGAARPQWRTAALARAALALPLRTRHRTRR